MADIWQQFHSLPKAIRDGVSTPKAIAAIDALENGHSGLDLANIIMRVVTREIPFSQLNSTLQTECKIDSGAAQAVIERLKADVFIGVIADYLGLTPPVPIKVATPPAVPTTPRPIPPPNLPVAPTQPSPMIPATPSVAKVAPVVKPPSVPAPAPVSPTGSQAPTTQYSDEDANEIANHAQRLKAMNATEPNQDLDTLARTILTEQNVAFSDELLDRRAIAIIKARLRDIRHTDETTTLLTHEPKIGGLGLDQEIAGQIAAAAERYSLELKTRGMVTSPVAPPPPPVPRVPSVPQQKPPPLPPMVHDAPPSPPFIAPNVTDKPRLSRPIVRPKDIPAPSEPGTVGASALTNPPPLEAPRRIVATTPPPLPSAPMMQGNRMTDRPTVADVVRPGRVTGPAEEIRSMTLIEFRRLGQGAADASRRLLEKFQHLEKESFSVWMEAINGWRQSDVYQLYLTMGRESLEQAAPISQIIADRGRAGQPYLSEHEFTVISDLNRQLQM